ncbi:MAG: hypothetical protein ACR2JK_11900 [Geodermatophilaceae bacterium]
MIGGLVVLAVLAGVVFLATRGGDPGPSTEAAGLEIEHVHGLGVDPEDGVLYVGTHYGLFRMPEQGEATRVADRVQDFMGFTVVGPSHYLAPARVRTGPPRSGWSSPPTAGTRGDPCRWPARRTSTP